MAQEPLKPFKGTLTPYKKCCVIDNGVITRMFWEHPAGNEEFDMDEVIQVWMGKYGTETDFTNQKFLSDHGFKAQNVIRDGHRPTS